MEEVFADLRFEKRADGQKMRSSVGERCPVVSLVTQASDSELRGQPLAWVRRCSLAPISLALP